MTTMPPSKRIRGLYDLMEAFPTERACVDHLVALRWPDGPVCPWCGTIGRAYRVNLRFKCSCCRKFFSVRKDTIFEESKISLRKWFGAIYLFISNRKGISSHQLAREIGVKQETAWFILSRLRQVADKMAIEYLVGVVEVDEAYVGGLEKNKHRDKKHKLQKQIVVGAVERDGYVTTDRIDQRDRYSLGAFIIRRIQKGATVCTDELPAYNKLPFHKHKNINHSIGQYADGDTHTQTIESFWAILKRAHKGIYHQWSKKHFDLYLREFELRWNLRKLPEWRRLDVFLANVNGTRLSYRDLINGRKRPRRMYERQQRKRKQRKQQSV